MRGKLEEGSPADDEGEDKSFHDAALDHVRRKRTRQEQDERLIRGGSQSTKESAWRAGILKRHAPQLLSKRQARAYDWASGQSLEKHIENR